MRTNRVPLVVLAAALSASAMESDLLNSERIAQRFGSYGIEVLAAGTGLRRSNLYSVEASGHVCRTYAVVQFTHKSGDELSVEHAKILAGSSIGAIFKEHGWQIDKVTLYAGPIAAGPSASDIYRLMQLPTERELAMHVYRLRLSKDALSIDYATIIEVHHPDYLTPTDLQQLYPADSQQPLDVGAVIYYSELALNTGPDSAR